ncbi:MAG: FGGY-family carbohydrate kinase, partial [Bacteroidaceae bacterium]
IKDTFCDQGHVMASVGDQLGIPSGIPVSYRAGDQPNNALSLGVVNPGQIAATAGTSGVVYGVNGVVKADPLNRVNNFVHVNHTAQDPRLGVLLCINGTGIQNAWGKRNLVPPTMNYAEMNDLGAKAPIGAEGISVLPFGNGAERMLQNREIGASINGIQFNHHNQSHIIRAVQEGIVFALAYGIDIMKSIGMEVSKIHAGQANMFLSPLFRDTLSGVTEATIDLFDTDGSVGAARGAGIGMGLYNSFDDAFQTLKVLKTITPVETNHSAYQDAYARWKEALESKLQANNY